MSMLTEKKSPTFKVTADRFAYNNLGADCDTQTEAFKTRYPEGAEVSRAVLKELAEAGMEIDWLAKQLLDVPQWEVGGLLPHRRWEEFGDRMFRATSDLHRAMAIVMYVEIEDSVGFTAEANRKYRRAGAAVLADILKLS